MGSTHRTSFGSGAVRRLSAVEAPHSNRLRARLRRVNGVVIILLAVTLAIGCYGFDDRRPGMWFAVDWLAVILLMGTMLALVAGDLRLTYDLRRDLSRKWRP